MFSNPGYRDPLPRVQISKLHQELDGESHGFHREHPNTKVLLLPNLSGGTGTVEGSPLLLDPILSVPCSEFWWSGSCSWSGWFEIDGGIVPSGAFGVWLLFGDFGISVVIGFGDGLVAVVSKPEEPWELKSMAWVIPCPWTVPKCLTISDADWSSGVMMIVWASWADTGLTCSGAHRQSFEAIVVHTVLLFSWITIFMGTIHWPGRAPFPCFQTITHSPVRYKFPLIGLDLRSTALRNAASLSALWYARRAHSRNASCCRNFRPTAQSESASKCAGNRWSLATEPGNLVCFPRTRTSGAKPFRRPHEFFAWVQTHRLLWRSVWDSIGCSISNCLSILWRIAPCLSDFPFWKWTSGLIVVL